MKKNKNLSKTDHHKNANLNEEPLCLALQNLALPDGFEEATGPLPFQMTNDALFHIVFEICPQALAAFISSLLRLPPEEIVSVEVTNPLVYRPDIYSKAFILDLKIHLNRDSVLNIELQVERLDCWKERSLCYLCRAFDQLNRGEQYLDTRSAIHVGILDFNLSPEDTEFYSTYYMINEVTQKKYSDKLRLSVLQLKQLKNATETDKKWHLDLWAAFFRAKTWEDMLMIAEQDIYIKDAAKTVYRVSTSDLVRSLCEGREEGEKTQRTIRLMHERELEQKDAVIRQKSETIQQQGEALLQKDKTIQHKDIELQQKDAEIARLLAKLNALNNSSK